MRNEHYDPSGLDGFWQMDAETSKVKDPETGEWVPEVIGGQYVEIRHDDEGVRFTLRIDHAPDCLLYMRYRLRYGQEEWTPYEVFHIEGDPEHEKLKPNPWRIAHARVGKPISYLKEIYVDPRTIVRITRQVDGSADYVLTSRLSEDGQRLVGRVFPFEGTEGIEKWMKRVDGFPFDWPA